MTVDFALEFGGRGVGGRGVGGHGIEHTASPITPPVSYHAEQGGAPGVCGRAVRRGRRSLRDGGDHADGVALGVGELADQDLGGDLVRAHQALAAEAFRLGECGLDVGDLDVEGDVPGVSLGADPDAAADPDAVGVGVALTRYGSVVHWVVGFDLPAEQVAVLGLQLGRILTDNLKVDNWLSHVVLLSASASAP